MMSTLWTTTTIRSSTRLVCIILVSLCYVESFSIQKVEIPSVEQATMSRRQIFSFVGIASLASALPARADAPKSLPELIPILKEARRQLEPIPGLIKAEKWDSVRAILIQPPLSDCWAKGSKTLLPNYAEAVGNAGGDELAALEAREEVITHLRFLDMAVYNNNFNPIATEGTSGATKELVRSYYEDPINEFKASVSALDELVQLGNV